MKPTPKNIEKLREEFAQEMIQEFEKEFGPIEEIKKKYTETEWRVMLNSLKFKGVPETVENAAIALDMLYDKWEYFIDLEQYMASGDWQKDYEAEERGELRKDIPKDVLSQDELYNSLMELDEVLKDMRRLVRHYKAPKKEK
jgi:hypothetical protein